MERNPAQRTHDDEDGGPLLIPGSTESDIWVSWNGKMMPDSGDSLEELATGRQGLSAAASTDGSNCMWGSGPIAAMGEKVPAVLVPPCEQYHCSVAKDFQMD